MWRDGTSPTAASRKANRQIYVDGQPLIFYRFGGLTQIGEMAATTPPPQQRETRRMLRRQIYGPYLDALGALERQVRMPPKSQRWMTQAVAEDAPTDDSGQVKHR